MALSEEERTALEVEIDNALQRAVEPEYLTKGAHRFFHPDDPWGDRDSVVQYIVSIIVRAIQSRGNSDAE